MERSVVTVLCTSAGGGAEGVEGTWRFCGNSRLFYRKLKTNTNSWSGRCMDPPDCSALSLLQEVARRAGRIDEVVTHREPSSHQGRGDRGESSKMSYKPAGRIVTHQAHHIQSNSLRSSANDFFGVGANADGADQGGRTSPVTITSTISPKARSQLLHFLDPLVLLFNAADFDALAASLAASCSKSVVVHTKLVPDGVAGQSPPVKPFCPGNPVPEYLHTSGVSAVLMFWMLLHEAHPDGVMQIIDKRICYRTVLPDRILTPRASTSAANGLSLVAKVQKTEQAPKSGPSLLVSLSQTGNGVKTAPAAENQRSGPTITMLGNNNINNGNSSSNSRESPVSIVEVVLKLSGACITTHSLHDLFCYLSSDTVPPLIAVPGNAGSVDADAPQNATYDTEGFSRYISTCLTKECCTEECLAAKEAGCICPATKKPKFDPNSLKPAEIRPSQPAVTSGPADFLHEHSRRYLLELRVVFDQFDVITDWTATVIAAETI